MDASSLKLRVGIAVGGAALAVVWTGAGASAAEYTRTTGSPSPAAGAPAPPVTKVPIPQPSQDGVRRLIVQYRPGAKRAAGESVPGSSRVSAAALTAGTSITSDLTTVRLDHPLGINEARLAARQLATDPGVAFAEPALPVAATATAPGLTGPQSLTAPNDPLLSKQWPLVGPFGVREGGATGGWSRSGGAGVVVAVLDTGITSHPDLAGRTVPGYDLISDWSISHDGDGRDADPSDPGDWTDWRSSSWHGTHVAGTIAAGTDNGVGVAGTAPLAKV